MYSSFLCASNGCENRGGCQFVGHPDWGSEPYLITIGDKVRISYDVSFVNHDGGIWVARNYSGDRNIIKVKRISVGNNVFIGAKSIIMPGVSIGNNCIVGAGAIVTKDIPDNCVYAGVPAKYICSIEEYTNKCIENCPEYDVTELRMNKKKVLIDITTKVVGIEK